MPKAADPQVGDALIATAARILAEDGASGLSLRRLAREVGTSTMAIYTHFGGMEELRAAVCRRGFERLADHLASVEPTDDPVADVAAQGLAYYRNAVENPHLYRAMFIDVPTAGDQLVDEDDVAVALGTFTTLVDGIARCIEVGRFHDADATERATEAWAGLHGTIALHLAGLLDEEATTRAVAAVAEHLFIGFGDEPEKVRASMAAVVAGGRR